MTQLPANKLEFKKHCVSIFAVLIKVYPTHSVEWTTEKAVEMAIALNTKIDKMYADQDSKIHEQVSLSALEILGK